MTEQQDPRIPKPRALPKSMREKTDAPAPEMPAPPPPPKIGADLVRYLEHHFPEKAYTPELVSNERVWFDAGTRVLALHLIGIAKKQKDSV
jgi:hypothetical protein